VNSAGPLAVVAGRAEADDVQNYVRAMLNILEDSNDEKKLLAATERAVLNILDDFTEERVRIAETQTALVNILEDASEEKLALADTQRAMLNILDDFEGEKANVDRVNLALTRSNDAVESANHELEAFSYSVAHDMRAPLRSIDGFSLALLEDCAALLPEEGKGYLRHIRDSAQHMARLIDDLLGLSRVSRAELRLFDVNLSDLARVIVSRLELNSAERTVETVIAPGLFARADPRLIEIALENLIGNAWKFSAYKPHARIEFGQFMQEGALVFFVRDNGAGFDMEYAGKLFAPFQRLHKVTEFDGTGIGLATVQRIISRHGGRIWADGKVGLGATFHFSFGEP
jgi:light-regulated signal transduction histidine kinase (bacteriophytochrome)